MAGEIILYQLGKFHMPHVVASTLSSVLHLVLGLLPADYLDGYFVASPGCTIVILLPPKQY